MPYVENAAADTAWRREREPKMAGNRPRPHIPLRVRIRVAIRQLNAAGKYALREEAGQLAWVLASNLRLLFGEDANGKPIKVHLDHQPPLRWRTYNERIKDPAARFTPNANDPDFLIYRTAEAHRFKTNVAGDGAQYPDRVLIKRERKREREAMPVKRQWARKRKWASRPFPQGRGFQNNHHRRS